MIKPKINTLGHDIFFLAKQYIITYRRTADSRAATIYRDTLKSTNQWAKTALKMKSVLSKTSLTSIADTIARHTYNLDPIFHSLDTSDCARQRLNEAIKKYNPDLKHVAKYHQRVALKIDNSLKQEDRLKIIAELSLETAISLCGGYQRLSETPILQHMKLFYTRSEILERYDGNFMAYSGSLARFIRKRTACMSANNQILERLVKDIKTLKKSEGLENLILAFKNREEQPRVNSHINKRDVLK